MKNTFFLVITIISFGFVSLQAQSKINYKQLPKNLSTSDANKMLNDYKKQRAKDTRMSNKEFQSLLKKVERATKSETAKYDAVLKKDKSGKYQKFQREMNAITQNKKLSNQQRLKKMKKLHKKYQPFFEAKKKEAKMNKRKMEQNLRRVLPPDFQFSLSPSFTIKQRKPSGQISSTPLTLNPSQSQGECREVPFTVEDEGIRIYVGNAHSEARPLTGEIGAQSEMFVAGGSSAVASLGHFFNIPSGVRRVKITGQFKVDAEGLVLTAGGVGGTGCYVKLNVHLRNSFVEDRIPEHSVSRRVLNILGTVAGFEEDEFIDPEHTLSTTITLPDTDGTTILVFGEILSESSGAGIGMVANSKMRRHLNELTKICVEYYYD